MTGFYWTDDVEPWPDNVGHLDLVEPEAERPARPNLWRRQREEGAACWFGLPGSGKSYELVRWLLREQEAGRQIWTTAGLELEGGRTIRTVEDFANIPDGSSVGIDEAPLWLDARAWQRMDSELLVRLTQVRKYGIRLRYTAIHPSMVEVTLRRITFRWIECRALFGPFNRYRAARSPEGSPKLRDSDGSWQFRRMSPDVCAAYNTLAKADVSEWASRRPGGGGRSSASSKPAPSTTRAA